MGSVACEYVYFVICCIAFFALWCNQYVIIVCAVNVNELCICCCNWIMNLWVLTCVVQPYRWRSHLHQLLQSSLLKELMNERDQCPLYPLSWQVLWASYIGGKHAASSLHRYVLRIFWLWLFLWSKKSKQCPSATYTCYCTMKQFSIPLVQCYIYPLSNVICTLSLILYASLPIYDTFTLLQLVTFFEDLIRYYINIPPYSW